MTRGFGSPRLRARIAGPEAAVDDQPDFDAFFGGVFPAEELDRLLGAFEAAGDVVAGAADEGFFAPSVSTLVFVVEQEGVEVGFDAEAGFGPLQVDVERFFRFDGDPEGRVFAAFAGIEVEALFERPQAFRASGGQAVSR